MTMLVRMRDEERGMALIVSILVSLVVLLLGTAVVAMAIHNSEQSGLDRKLGHGAGDGGHRSDTHGVGGAGHPPGDFGCIGEELDGFE